MPDDVLLTRDGRAAAELWPPSGLVHLNHGSYGRVPLAASAHQRDLQDRMESAPMAFMARGPEAIAAARAAIAPYLQVEPDRFALVPNASAGISTVLRSLPPAPGAEVLITDHAYGAVRMGIERAAREVGAVVRIATVPLDADATTATEAIWSEVSDRTTMIVLDHITSGSARLMPVGAVARRARERGILTVVDGAHAALLLPDPVADAGVDVWVGNLHKFGCAPRGTAALVARAEIADRLRPLIDSWGAPEDFPRRFDWQGSDDYTAWLAAPVALDHLEAEIGWDRIRAHATATAADAVATVGRALADRYGYDPAVDVGMPIGPIRLLALPPHLSADADALRARLRDAGFEIQLTAPGGRLMWRVAPHAYTTGEDVAAFVERALPLLDAAVVD